MNYIYTLGDTGIDATSVAAVNIEHEHRGGLSVRFQLNKGGEIFVFREWKEGEYVSERNDQERYEFFTVQIDGSKVICTEDYTAGLENSLFLKRVKEEVESFKTFWNECIGDKMQKILKIVSEL